MTPEVSVILPVRNVAPFVHEALDSVLAQSFENIEVVVVDHSSDDGTFEICRDVAATDPRVVLESYAPSSFAEVLNFAVGRARAPFLARTDGDDRCHPERIALQVKMFHELDLDVLGTNVTLIDSEGASIGSIEYPLEHDQITDELRFRSPLCHASVLMRREVLDAAGGYRMGLNIAEDLDLWLRIAETGGRFANLEVGVYEYRQHGNQASASDSTRSFGKLNVIISAAYRRLGLDDPFSGDAAWNEPRVDLLIRLPGVDGTAVEGLGIDESGLDDRERVRRVNHGVRMLTKLL